jgi:formamidase
MFPARPIEPSEPGRSFTVFDIPDKGRMGLMVCYDHMFPEITRTLAWMGAEVIIHPSLQTDSEGGQRSETPVIITRALENQCFAISVNAAAPIGNGNSCIVDPEGRIVEKLGNVESFTTAVLDLDYVHRIRKYGGQGGGFTFLKHWATLSVDNYPPYVQGIRNGEVFKDIGLDWPEDPSKVKAYPR